MMGSMQSDFFFFGAFHILGTLSFFIGIFLLVFWAIKHLAAHQLYLWGLTLVGTGVILSLLAFLALSVSGGNTREDMRSTLSGKTGDDFDAAFLDTMIEHHQGAIDMANTALNDAGHDEIKEMADRMIGAQQEEIDRMREWQQSWGFTQ